MCGRYTLQATGEQLAERFDVPQQTNLWKTPRFNVAPGQFNPVIVNDGKNRLELMKWGFVPSWSKEPKVNFFNINARSETLLDKPTYRKPFRTQRCLVPATGFYEWQEVPGNVKRTPKIPFYFYLRPIVGGNSVPDNEDKTYPIFALAGLYDVWHGADGQELKTYTILNTAANPLMAQVHPRMPVILTPEAEKLWLDPNQKDENALLDLLQPYPTDLMDLYQVSLAVNKVANDSPDLIAPVQGAGVQVALL